MKEKALLPYLHCFWQVSRLSSFTKAAEALHVSQSAVSYQVKLLEEHLGLSLLDRERRNAVRLTPAGQVLADRCHEMFAGLHQTLDMLQGRTLSGDLTIAAPTCFGTLFLSEVVTRLRQKYPAMHTHLRLSEAHIDLRSEQVDMALRSITAGEGIYSQPLFKLAIKIVASKGYAEQHGLPQSFAELHDHNMIFSDPADHDWQSLREQVPEVPLLQENVTYIDNSLAIMASLRAGLGLSCMPMYIVADELQKGDLVEVLPEQLAGAHFVMYLCSPLKIDDNPKAKAALAILREFVDQYEYREIFEWLG